MPVVTTRLPAAVLWDMDGTLVDTEPYWIHAETELVRAFGGDWTDEDGLQLVGSGLWDSAAVFQRAGVDLPADEIVRRLTAAVRELIIERGAPWRPGALELLSSIREAGVPTALVTMSLRGMAEDIVAEVPFEAFELIIAGDMVENPKPHPEPYLRAAERLGVDIAACIALEDSPPGVAAGVASGAFTIGVPHIASLDESEAHLLLPSLAGVTSAELFAAAASHLNASELAGSRPPLADEPEEATA